MIDDDDDDDKKSKREKGKGVGVGGGGRGERAERTGNQSFSPFAVPLFRLAYSTFLRI